MSIAATKTSAADASASTRVAELMRWGGWWLVIVCALLRCLVASDPFPYWGIDPGRTILPITGLTPASSMSLDSVMLLGCGIAMLGEILVGATVLWMPLLLWALGSIGVALHALVIGAGSIDDLRIGATWAAAMGAGLTAMHVCRDSRVRRVTLAATIGIIVMLAAKGAVQVFYEHAMTVERYRLDREGFLAAQGWTPGSASARNFERRLNQPEATGWFGMSNVYATFAAACLTALAGCAVLAWREVRLSRRIPDGWAGVLTLGAVAALGAVFLAWSKGGFGAAGIGLMLLAAIVVLRRGNRLARVTVRHAGLAALGLVALVLLGVVGRGLLGESLDEPSLLFRWFYMQGATRAFVESPLFGTGPEGFKDAYMRLKPTLSPEEVSSPHSLFFDLVARLGVFGVLWAGLWIRWIYGLGVAMVRPSVEQAATSSRGEGWLVILAAAVPVLASTWMERVMGSPEQAGARIGGLAGWVGVSIGLLMLLRCSKSAGVAIAAAALVAVVHGQIEVTLLWNSSVPWMCILMGAAGAGSHAERPTGRIERRVLAPALLITMAVSTTWFGVVPTSRWELALSEAGAQMRPMAEIRTRLGELSSERASGVSEQAILQELSRLTGVPAPLSQAELDRALAMLAEQTTNAALPHLEQAALLAPRHFPTREALVRTSMEHAVAAEFTGQRAQARTSAVAAGEQARDLVRRHPSASSWGLLGNVEAAMYAMSRETAHLDQAIEAWESGARLDPFGLSLPLQAFKAALAAGRDEAARALARRLLELDALQRLDDLKRLGPDDRAAVERAAQPP